MSATPTERVVFLDRATLPVRMHRPRCALDYVEFDHSAPEQLIERLHAATVAITNKVPLRAAVLARLPQLRLIAVAATGYDCIDVEHCRAHGIAVSNIRNYAVHAVPEHVFALILALRRNLLSYRALVREGGWQRAPRYCAFGAPLRDLHGSLLAIVGRGSLGRATAQLGQAFGMRVLFAQSLSGRAADEDDRPLAELLASADVISLHCPLSAATRGLIGESQLRSMKRDALLINTARGGLVDERSLASALREGWIGGAGFDVLSIEPPRDGNPLLELDLPNFLLTPHIAWASTETMERLADQLTENVDAWAQGRPRNLVS
jgi:glycerate dehydrogenase